MEAAVMGSEQGQSCCAGQTPCKLPTTISRSVAVSGSRSSHSSHAEPGSCRAQRPCHWLRCACSKQRMGSSRSACGQARQRSVASGCHRCVFTALASFLGVLWWHRLISHARVARQSCTTRVVSRRPRRRVPTCDDRPYLLCMCHFLLIHKNNDRVACRKEASPCVCVWQGGRHPMVC